MNWAHVHLILNHFPVVTAVLGLPLLLASMLRSGDALRRAALGAFVAAALLALPAYFTGEPAEERIDRWPGIEHRDIERHEKSAEIATLIVCLQGAIALVALVLPRRHPALPAPIATLLLVLSVTGAVLMARTANLGGMIRHPEIRSAAPARPGP